LADGLRQLSHVLRTLWSRLPNTRGLLWQPPVQVIGLYEAFEHLGYATCHRTVPTSTTRVG